MKKGCDKMMPNDNSLLKPLGSSTEPEALDIGLHWPAIGRMAGQTESVTLGKLESVLTVWLVTSSRVNSTRYPNLSEERFTSRTSPQPQQYLTRIIGKVENQHWLIQRYVFKKRNKFSNVVQLQFPSKFHTITSLQRALFVFYYITYYYITHSQLI